MQVFRVQVGPFEGREVGVLPRSETFELLVEPVGCPAESFGRGTTMAIDGVSVTKDVGQVLRGGLGVKSHLNALDFVLIVGDEIKQKVVNGVVGNDRLRNLGQEIVVPPEGLAGVEIETVRFVADQAQVDGVCSHKDTFFR